MIDRFSTHTPPCVPYKRNQETTTTMTTSLAVCHSNPKMYLFRQIALPRAGECCAISRCVDRGSISLLFFFCGGGSSITTRLLLFFFGSVTELLLFGSAISTRGAGVTLGRSLGDPAQQWEREKRSNSPIVRVPYHKPLIRIGDRERGKKQT